MVTPAACSSPATSLTICHSHVPVQIVEALAERLEAAAGSSGAGARPLLVVDPVLVATSGDALATGGVMEAMRQHLLPAATIVTPNVPEASALLGALLLHSGSEHVSTSEGAADRVP